MRSLAVGVGASMLFAVGVCSASAGQATYGLKGTKACLVKKGAQLQTSYTGALADLTPRQRSESLVGTLPAGSAPVFLYLAVGHNRADALAVRKVLEKGILPNPTPQDSWSGDRANAAWILVSLGGSPPGTAVRKLLLPCLTKGTPPSGNASPSRYDRAQVAMCMQLDGRAAVLSAKDLAESSELLLGTTVPTRFVSHLLFAFTSTSPATHDGLRLFALFGKTHADALSLRSQLDKALKGVVLGPAIWTGAKKNVAWAASRLRGTTRPGIASGKRTLLSCLP